MVRLLDCLHGEGMLNKLKDILIKFKIKFERDNYIMKDKYDQWITISALIKAILDFIETGDEFKLSQFFDSLSTKPSIPRDIKIDMKLNDKHNWTDK